MLLRLLMLRSAGAGELTDQFLRRQLLDELREHAELRYMVAGRGAPEPDGRRTVVTLWQEPLTGVRDLAELLPSERDGPLVDAQVELHDVAIAHDSGSWDAATILRIFRGRAQPGVLERYLADVRRGTVEDISQGHGPVGLFLAQTGVDEFVTVSAWNRWADIERATGGNIRQPFATRHAYRLSDGEAEHLEIVPGATIVAPSEEPTHGALLPNPVAG